MWQRIKEIYQFREMLRHLVAKELQSRYKGSVLGFLWTFFNPLLMLVVYSVVFSFVMRSELKDYAMFLFVALLPWNYLSASIMQGAASIVQNAALVKKVYFPREVLPLAVVLTNLVNYVLSLFILIPALLLFQIQLTPALAAFPLILLVQTFLVAGLTFLVAVGNVFFRDLEHITGVLITAWFFMTPVLYGTESMPPQLQAILVWNPATPLMEAYRAVFYYGRWPDWTLLGWLGLAYLGFCLLSMVVFSYFQRSVAEEI